jgi:hypothetical protein
MFDPQFTVDADQAPTFTCKNYNSEDGSFEVHFNSPELNLEDDYVVVFNVNNMKSQEEEPVLFQVAQLVFWEVEKLKKEEQDKKPLVLALTAILNTPQTVEPATMNRHREAMYKKNSTILDPVLSTVQVANVHGPEDFDNAFEAASQEAASE